MFRHFVNFISTSAVCSASRPASYHHSINVVLVESMQPLAQTAWSFFKTIILDLERHRVVETIRISPPVVPHGTAYIRWWLSLWCGAAICGRIQHELWIWVQLFISLWPRINCSLDFRVRRTMPPFNFGTSCRKLTKIDVKSVMVYFHSAVRHKYSCMASRQTI